MSSLLFGYKKSLDPEHYKALVEVIARISKEVTFTGAANFAAWAAGGWLQLEAARYLAGVTHK
eukprot:2977167-Pyramimonas_sp.AAC.1